MKSIKNYIIESRQSYVDDFIDFLNVNQAKINLETKRLSSLIQDMQILEKIIIKLKLKKNIKI